MLMDLHRIHLDNHFDDYLTQDRNKIHQQSKPSFTIGDFSQYIVHYCIEIELHYYIVDIDSDFHHHYLDNH